ncbi:MAG: sigma-54 dependent transcriptional regulator [Halioglobus sp.]
MKPKDLDTQVAINRATILVADDDTSVQIALSLFLKTSGFVVLCASSPAEAIKKAQQSVPDLALIDLNYCEDTTSGIEGLELLSELRKLNEQLPVVVMTGWGTIQLSVEAMRRGANDFIEKPWDNNRLLAIINTQLKLAKTEQRAERLSAENALLKPEPGELIAVSPAMTALMETITRVAPTDLSILITGENGTGKSMLARHIHELSTRHGQAFIPVNMGGLSESGFESEMFGHVKGAYTDAKNTRVGRVELAQGGTLFLDEIANTPLPQQAKLLRLLEERQFEKLGSSVTQKADIRLIAATNADLDKLIQSQEFRQDLYFRIHSIVIELPPLRQRQDDIPLLALQFLQLAAKQFSRPDLVFSDEAVTHLCQYNWPGNVRELHHVIERACLLCPGDAISADDLQLTLATTTDPGQNINPANDQLEKMTLEEAERWLIELHLTKQDGNAALVAKALGLSRSAIYRRLDKYGMNYR